MSNLTRKTFFMFFLLVFLRPVMAQNADPIRLDPNMTLIQPDSNGIVWLDPMKTGQLGLAGFEWIEKEGKYRRLPEHPRWEIPPSVDGLADHTAGGQVRFRTDSRKILVRVELLMVSNMYHMPPTGQSGFDLYIGDHGEQHYYKTTRFDADSIRYVAELYSSDKKKMQAFTINFPLYNGVKVLQIGLEEGARLEAPEPFRFPGKIVIYGTSITQGGCVARPGMAYSNILSRKLDARFVNLGFSGSGKGEPALAHLIDEIPDVSFIILDYEANAGVTIRNTLGPFVDILREKHPRTPILIMSKIHYARQAKEYRKTYKEYIALRDFQRDFVKERRKGGDAHIWFLDGSQVLGEDFDECTVDGVHPTDLGSYRIAGAMLEKINSILAEEKR
jgi:lysophospholipase L1-like esterase